MNTRIMNHPGRDRSINTRSLKTEHERGSSRPTSTKLVQLPGPNGARIIRKTERSRRRAHKEDAMDRTEQFVGIDISKTRLDLAIHPQDAVESATHDEPGILRVVNRLQALQPTSIVLEATGGFERGLVRALAAAQ